MNLFTNLSDTIQGIIFLAAGLLILFNTIGIGGKTVNMIVMLAGIGLIILGMYVLKAPQYVYKLLAKEKKSKGQEEMPKEETKPTEEESPTKEIKEATPKEEPKESKEEKPEE